MPRYWTSHWQKRFWDPSINKAEFTDKSGSNLLQKRGVKPGHILYVVSLDRGQLMLGGRMTVSRVRSRRQVVREFGGDESFYPADWWAVCDDSSATRLDLKRQLSPELTRELKFKTKTGERGLFFLDGTDVLDRQAIRGVRELTSESANLLDHIIDLTDQRPLGEPVTVTEEIMRIGVLSPSVPVLYDEGAVRREEVLRRERNRAARDACLRHYGATCNICRFDFADAYGPNAAGLMHVHHLAPLAAADGPRTVDPVVDLRPVCPNCHAVIHRRDPPFEPEEVRAMLGGRVVRAVAG